MQLTCSVSATALAETGSCVFYPTHICSSPFNFSQGKECLVFMMFCIFSNRNSQRPLLTNKRDEKAEGNLLNACNNNIVNATILPPPSYSIMSTGGAV